jgi:hypothetical protein
MSDSFAILPADGTFDVDAIVRYIETLPYTARDQVLPHVFMLTDSYELLEYLVKDRENDPDRFSPSVTLVQVEPQGILLTPGTDGIPRARQFVQWLAHRYKLRFIDPEMNDVTAQCEQNLDLLFATP